MPPPDRRRYDERDDDRDPPPRRSSMSPLAIVALVLGGVLVLGGCLVFGGFALLWTQVESPRGKPAGAADVAEAKKYTRQEFRALVMGKTEGEVIAAVGKPDETSEAGNVTRWTYRDRINDPAIGKADPAVTVVFRDGRVAEVTYSLGPA